MLFISRSFLTLSCVGLTSIAAAGCKETVSSENIRTGGISMKTVVTAGSSSSRVRVTLTVGGDESNTYVVLESGDELIAEADGQEKKMEKEADGIYEATFDTNEEDTAFTVHLLREDDDDATGNTGTLPPPFAITSDLGDDPISRADDLELTWEPSSTDEMTLEVDDEVGESCIFAKTFTRRSNPALEDDGQYVIEGGELDGTSGDDETCEIILDLRREREGYRDAKLDPESTFFLYQVRSTTALSAP